MKVLDIFNRRLHNLQMNRSLLKRFRFSCFTLCITSTVHVIVLMNIMRSASVLCPQSTRNETLNGPRLHSPGRSNYYMKWNCLHLGAYKTLKWAATAVNKRKHHSKSKIVNFPSVPQHLLIIYRRWSRKFEVSNKSWFTELFTFHCVIQASADCNEEIGMHVSECSHRYSLDDTCVSVP